MDHSHDTFEFIKSQSSVIQCEPSNFLKDSERKEGKPNNCQVICDSFFESEECPTDQFVKNKKKVYIDQEKENFQDGNANKRGRKKIDRLMEMLERSHMISDKVVTENSRGG